ALVRLAVVPEAGALDGPVRRGDRREVRVAAALPVAVLERHVLVIGDVEVALAQHHVATVGQHGQLVPHARPGTEGSARGRGKRRRTAWPWAGGPREYRLPSGASRSRRKRSGRRRRRSVRTGPAPRERGAAGRRRRATAGARSGRRPR